MTITILSEFAPPLLQEYAEGNVITTADLLDIIQAHNLQWSMAGMQTGVVFDPVFTTTSATYTVSNASGGGRDLDTMCHAIRSVRRAESAGTECGILEVTAMMAKGTLGFGLYSGETYIGALEATQASTTVTKTTAGLIIPGAVGCLTVRPLGMKTASGTARCASYVLRDARLTGTNFPRGR